MPFAKHAACALAAALSLLAAPVAVADEVPQPAAKVDSGLGALPHYAQWNEPWGDNKIPSV